MRKLVESIKLGKNVFLSSENEAVVVRDIHIVFATDKNYAPHCMAAIASILFNCDKTSTLSFHILDSGLTADEKAKFEIMRSIRDFAIDFYDMKKFDFSQFPLNRKHISEVTYYRLLLPEILPETVGKVIYLDCDIIVEQDLKQLWDVALDDFLIAGSEDEGSITQAQRLGLPDEYVYFNAGVLLFNIERLRGFNLLQKCVEYYKKNEDKITLQDQDMLNGVLGTQAKILPLCWNTNGRLYCKNNLKRHYSGAEGLQTAKNPAIIHYTDAYKPWMRECSHPLKEEYWRYLAYTPYKEKLLCNKWAKLLAFLYSVSKNTSMTEVKVFGIPIFKQLKAGVKAIFVFGFPVFARFKSERRKKVYLFGVKILDKRKYQ